MAESAKSPTQKTTNEPTKAPASKKSEMGLGLEAEKAPTAANLNAARYSPANVMYLQRTVGNRATAQLLGRSGQSNRAMPLIQTKLTVGPADDKYESEADQVAASVMRSPDPAPKSSAKQDETDQVQRTPVINRIQRTAPVGLEGGEVSGDLERSLNTAKSGGSSLPSGMRSKLEPKLNADLGDVKVHTDTKAMQLNRDLGAKAFTHKNHIFYGAGQSPNDVKLTSHEAVHTIQQGAVTQRSVQRTDKNKDKKDE